MKYGTVEISRNSRGTAWEVRFTDLQGDRLENKESLSPMGFFHYQETRTKEMAFTMLKSCMVERHEKEIAKLQKSLDKLKKLKFKE